MSKQEEFLKAMEGVAKAMEILGIQDYCQFYVSQYPNGRVSLMMDPKKMKEIFPDIIPTAELNRISYRRDFYTINRHIKIGPFEFWHHLDIPKEEAA